MADRRQQVLQLLASRYDQLYLPAGALRTPSGLSPAKKIPCPSCGHLPKPGWITDAFKRSVPCVKCGGKTHQHPDSMEHEAGKGYVMVDPMDSLEVPVGSAETVATARPRKVVTCDRCAGEGVWKSERCALCDGQGTRPQHIFELHLDTHESSGDPMTDAIDRRNQSGSYRELELALAGIRTHVNKPPKYHWLTLNAVWTLRLLDEVFLVKARSEVELTPTERALVDLALDYLQSRMPDPIRVPSEVRANARESVAHRERVKHTRGLAARQRDSEIRSAIRRGVPTQRVAFEYGISVRRVNQIIAGESDAA